MATPAVARRNSAGTRHISPDRDKPGATDQSLWAGRGWGHAQVTSRMAHPHGSRAKQPEEAVAQPPVCPGLNFSWAPLNLTLRQVLPCSHRTSDNRPCKRRPVMPRIPADPSDPGRSWRVGELAERTGLTVRTLHHYDAIGLLSPSGRTSSAHGSGHRLYTAADVARLQQIVSLKHLGFALEQIRDYLAGADYDPRRVVRLHLERVRGQAAELKRLEDR